MAHFWTDERDARLREAYEAGKTYDAIAEELNSSRSAVSLRIKRLGLTREFGRGGEIIKPYSDAEIERVRALRASGVSWRDIGKELNRSPTALSSAARRFGIPRGRFMQTSSASHHESEARPFVAERNPAIDRAEPVILRRIKASAKIDEAAAIAEVNNWNQQNPDARLRHVGEYARDILAKLKSGAAA